MIDLKKMDIEELIELIEYLLQNRNNIETVINDFGEVIKDNGNGTVFLKPRNPLLKVFWIYQQNGLIKTVGLGGAHLHLTLEEIYEMYNNYEEGYSRFENQFIYVFFKSNHYTHTIRITSSVKLMDKKEIVNNIRVTGFEISFE
jgi:hypothetical protein